MKLKYFPLYLAAFVCLGGNNVEAQSMAPLTNRPPPPTPSLADTNGIILPQLGSDPMEPFNRAVWTFNRGLMTSVVQPAAKGYRVVAAKPVRTDIGNFGRNLASPGRFINELLQGDWRAMNYETERFLCNTLFGFGGFLDVATRWHVPRPETDFAQTFQKWGCQPGMFLMLPIYGPSDARDATGVAGDVAANPLTYFPPFSLISTGVTLNNFSDSVDEAVRFSQTEADSYSILQYAWLIRHENRAVDLRVVGRQDEASLETLEAFFGTCVHPEFLRRGKTQSVLIPATGKHLDFTFWLQPGTAPVVYLVPGFGAHRLSGDELALAELIVSNGYSAVCVSSIFHPEFMEHASTSDLPAYLPKGVDDLHRLLTEIDRHLDTAYPHRLSSRAMLGYSMGGFQSLLLAGTEPSRAGQLIKFQRYVAIDSPVRMRYAITNLDDFYNAPLAWPAGERAAAIENTLLKVAALTAKPPASGVSLPFNAIESRFLIGLSFRLALRDVIFDSQLRHNQGVLRQPVNESRRRPVYNEILKYSFQDYVNEFAVPYDRAHGIDLIDPDIVRRGTDLTSYTAELQTNADIRVILNRNDFLLAERDVAWAESTFDTSRLTLFSKGGHMGNLNQPEVQQAILQALDGLGRPHNKITEFSSRTKF